MPMKCFGKSDFQNIILYDYQSAFLLIKSKDDGKVDEARNGRLLVGCLERCPFPVWKFGQ